jgi:nucleotide-binding universal stress UspA family protein
MIKIKRIIVPTDFSPVAPNALEYATAVALDYKAKIFLVHVMEDMGFNASYTLTSVPVIEQYHHGIEEIVKKRLQEVVCRTRNNELR